VTKQAWFSNYKFSDGKVKSTFVLASSKKHARYKLREKYPTATFFNPYIPWKFEFPKIKNYRQWHRRAFPQLHWMDKVPLGMFGLKICSKNLRTEKIFFYTSLEELINKNPQLLQLDSRFKRGFYPSRAYLITNFLKLWVPSK